MAKTFRHLYNAQRGYGPVVLGILCQATKFTLQCEASKMNLSPKIIYCLV
jgi:hypothetical protein